VLLLRPFHQNRRKALPLLQAAAAREKEMRLMIVVLNKAGAEWQA
jgi:hypothetical protein